MKKFWALIIARNREFYRDRTAMIWTLIFPFIVLAGFTYGYSGKQEPLLRVTLFPEGAENQPIARALREIPAVDSRVTNDEALATKKLERYETDLIVSVGEHGEGITYAVSPGSDKSKLAERLLINSRDSLPEPRPRLQARSIQGHRIRYSDWLLPGLLAMNIMFGSMFGVGYVIVRYRKNGVLKRLRATPLQSFQFLLAQVFSRMLITLFTSFVVVGGAMLLIGFKPSGSWLDLAFFLAISATAMISLGLLVAARISSEEVADGVLNLMTWPMIFLSGIWFSLDGASPWVLFGAKLMPLSHVVSGLRAIMIDGASLKQIAPEISVLLVLSAFFVGIASVVFRWR